MTATQPSLQLVLPAAHLRNGYRALVAEFVASGEALVPFTLAFDHTDFPAFRSRLEDCAAGTGIPEGFVAHSTFWLVRDGVEVVGVSNIRHTLTPALRREGARSRSPQACRWRSWKPWPITSTSATWTAKRQQGSPPS